MVPLVAEMMDTGMMASSDVEVMRVLNDLPANPSA